MRELSAMFLTVCLAALGCKSQQSPSGLEPQESRVRTRAEKLGRVSRAVWGFEGSAATCSTLLLQNAGVACLALERAPLRLGCVGVVRNDGTYISMLPSWKLALPENGRAIIWSPSCKSVALMAQDDTEVFGIENGVVYAAGIEAALSPRVIDGGEHGSSREVDREADLIVVAGSDAVIAVAIRDWLLRRPYGSGTALVPRGSVAVLWLRAAREEGACTERAGLPPQEVAFEGGREWFGKWSNAASGAVPCTSGVSVAEDLVDVCHVHRERLPTSGGSGVAVCYRDSQEVAFTWILVAGRKWIAVSRADGATVCIDVQRGCIAFGGNKPK